MKTIWKFAALCAASCISVSAHSALINVDPDQFASGTDITNAFEGITLSTCVGEPNICDRRESVFSLTSGDASTGTLGFAHDSDNATWGNGVFEWLQIDFSVAFDMVSLDFAANDAGGDSNAQLLAFDTSGVLIDIDTQDFVASGEFTTLTVNGTNISYVQAYWDEINRGESGALDNLVYNAVDVSTPATAAFLGLGVLGLALRRRKQG